MLLSNAEELGEMAALEVERLKRCMVYASRDMTFRDRTRSRGVISRSRSRRAARKLRENEIITR